MELCNQHSKKLRMFFSTVKMPRGLLTQMSFAVFVECKAYWSNAIENSKNWLYLFFDRFALDVGKLTAEYVETDSGFHLIFRHE